MVQRAIATKSVPILAFASVCKLLHEPHILTGGTVSLFVDNITGLRVESYGTGTQVRLPGRTAMGKYIVMVKI